MYDVVIIGSGIVGAMTARKLSQYNLKICIVERENDVAMGATKANSAIIHAGFDAKTGSLMAKLNVKGSEMMAEICHDLSVDYKNNGTLVIGYTDEDKERLEELFNRGKANGVKKLELIDQNKLRTLEPNISDNAKYALYAPTSAIVCPYDLCIASIGNAMDNGAELKLNFDVTAIAKTENGYKITSAMDESIETQIVINAAGLFADEIADQLGVKHFAITPRKGEYMLLDKEFGDTVKRTIFTVPTKMGKGILVSPTVDNNLILGPTSENIEDKTNKRTTREGINAVRKNAENMVNGINFGGVITSFGGLRAAGDTGDFIIDMPTFGFVNAAGIESPGLSASPAIAEYISELLISNNFTLTPKPNYKKERKSYKHFVEFSDEEKNEIIKADPSFGKICCRCENITEGEIRHAIRTNPKPRDLDGVKRRTRAQMGRCQGGFCSTTIMQLLADELGVSLEEITKSGKNSYVVSHKLKEALQNEED